MVVHGSVNGVLQTIPVCGEGSSVWVFCKKVMAVASQVLSDLVFVSSRVEKNRSASL